MCDVIVQTGCSTVGKSKKSAAALRLRRLKWYQQWARYPKDHGAVLAAVLGTTQGERKKGITRLQEDKWICDERSTPMALQLREDLEMLSEVCADMTAWYTQRTSDLDMFTPGTDDWRQWTSLDTSVLRSFLGSQPLAEATAEGMEQVEVILRPFCCDFKSVDSEGGQCRVCAERFTSMAALKAHRREKHRITPLVSSLVISNQCPWCLSTFATRRIAADHATRATEGHGICFVNHSAWVHDIIAPADEKLECPCCDFKAQNLATFQLHVRQHHPGPVAVRYPKDARGHNHAAATRLARGTQERSRRTTGSGRQAAQVRRKGRVFSFRRNAKLRPVAKAATRRRMSRRPQRRRRPVAEGRKGALPLQRYGLHSVQLLTLLRWRNRWLFPQCRVRAL